MNNSTDSKEERISDSAFIKKTVISIACIILCMISLCSTTYAWFVGSSESSKNKLSSGIFDVEVSVSQSAAAEGAKSGELTVTKGEGGTFSCKFEEAGLYDITLKMTDEANVKGYCVIKIDEERYFTDVIVREGSNPYNFTLDIKDANLTVYFDPVWGIPAEASISMGASLELGKN